jgi:hypothetical protein
LLIFGPSAFPVIGSASPTNLAVPASCGFEDAMAQQVKSGTSAHRALDRFQAADLSFHRAGTPRQRQARPDRRQTRPLPVSWCNRMLENNFFKRGYWGFYGFMRCP